SIPSLESHDSTGGADAGARRAGGAARRCRAGLRAKAQGDGSPGAGTGHRGNSNMKFRCDRKGFLEVVGLLGGGTAGAGARPVPQHILIKATGSALELLATALEVALRCRHKPLVIEEPGSICPPAAMLSNILREAQGETIDVSTDGNVILLRSG